MGLLRQLEFIFWDAVPLTRRLQRSPWNRDRVECREGWGEGFSNGFASARDLDLEFKSRELLRQLGAVKLAREIRVEWNPRLRSAAGRADYREKLISLNPLLWDLSDGLARTEFGADKLDCLKQSSLTTAAESVAKKSRQHVVVHTEIDRTLRHELAHLLAQFRVGRRRIAPHGKEWRQACVDLGIADEVRCHNLPFATKSFPPRYVYRCPNCDEKFPRVRRIRRAIACLACCQNTTAAISILGFD